MCEVDHDVGVRAVQFQAAQTSFDRERTGLHRQLYRAFARLWSGSAGDHIQATTTSGYRPHVEGRAVILRDGMRMGLYVDTKDGRYEVRQPYAEHARIIPRKKSRTVR
jgi:hypothetical protein